MSMIVLEGARQLRANGTSVPSTANAIALIHNDLRVFTRNHTRAEPFGVGIVVPKTDASASENPPRDSNHVRRKDHAATRVPRTSRRLGDRARERRVCDAGSHRDAGTGSGAAAEH